MIVIIILFPIALCYRLFETKLMVLLQRDAENMSVLYFAEIDEVNFIKFNKLYFYILLFCLRYVHKNKNNFFLYSLFRIITKFFMVIIKKSR